MCYTYVKMVWKFLDSEPISRNKLFFIMSLCTLFLKELFSEVARSENPKLLPFASSEAMSSAFLSTKAI